MKPKCLNSTVEQGLQRISIPSETSSRTECFPSPTSSEASAGSSEVGAGTGGQDQALCLRWMPSAREKPELTCAAHIKSNWKTVYVVPHKPTRTEGPAVATCAQTSACPSIQAGAGHQLHTVSQSSMQQGTDISEADWCTHQECAPEDLTVAIITHSGVPPVLGWGWEGQLCIRGVRWTCLCLQEVTEATARPFK